ncbi:MAG: DUF5995 family protein [Bacteroidia bacterium]|nr:DUF5995 family protein [Bacteroidia bacterium]
MSNSALKPIYINRETCSIDEVIDQLGRIIDWAEEQNNPLGFFPALYQAVTIRVANGIKIQRFADGGGMEKLDVVFANRYFEALDRYLKSEKTTQSWKLAFDQHQRDDLIVLQHLLLGINAHINLDLGLSAAKVAKTAGQLKQVEADFLEINYLLQEMIEEVQDRLNTFSLIWKSADFLLGKADELMASFSLKRSRKLAWKIAEEAYLQADPYAPSFIASMDRKAEKMGKVILSPPNFMLTTGLRLMGKFSFTDANAIICELRKPYD